MEYSVADLKAKLKLCRTLDQRRFKRKLSQLNDAHKGLGRLAEDIAASVNWVEARQQLAAPVQFPDLPVSSRKDEIAEAIATNQVVVIAGETGSGKTTQLPKICWELGRGKFGQIGHTQPRRLAARAVANRIAEELQTELGLLVGFQIRFGDQTTEQTRIKLMTDGILLAEIQQDPLLNRYDTLIIDEAHERSLNIDFLLGYLKRILPKRPDLKLIITSATIDLERFSKHFDNAPIIEVSGRTYPVDVHYRPLVAEDADQADLSVQQAIAATLEEIESAERKSQGQGRGDVLIFMNGERDIRETADFLRKQNFRDTDILPLYARLSAAEQNRIFHPSGRGRRVVLSTNVAETSLTVPGIRYVIDPGTARISRYSYRSKIQRLPIEPISQASANQRKGRCGRVAEGVCFRLYSEDDFNLRPEFTDAEILRTNLAAVILQMQGLRLGAIEDFPFIDPPDSRVVRDGVRLLQELKALDAKGNITPLGKQLSRLPVDPKFGRMLIEGAKNQSLRELLIIVSALSVQDPRERPLDKQQKADEAHREYQDKESDFISYINLWEFYEEKRQALSNNQLRQFCQKRFLAFMRMREWRDLHRQLHLACRDLGLKENNQPAGYATIHKALLSGLLGNLGFRQEEGDYLGARGRHFRIFPGSGIAKKKPKWIVAAEIVETSQLFARTVAKIDPQWAESLAAHIVKHSYSEPHWERKPAEVIAYEQQTLYGLPIVNRRKAHYGKINPQEAQEIFIRSGLVEGDFHTQGDFFQHNRDMLAEVEALEDKSRRRDILIDEDQLFDFYQSVLLENDGEAVVNGASFERWRKNQEKQQPDLLKVNRAQLMNHDAKSITEARYPERFSHQGMVFPLSYNFAPGAIDDGVSIKVPVAALSQLPAKRLQWLVPGMLTEKCVAMLKGLPKQVRKNFVPIPDYVAAFLERQPDTDESLTEQLSLHLRKMTGTYIEPELWQQLKLEDHYRFNIQVLGENGELLSQGRDWQPLVAKYSGMQKAIIPQAKEKMTDIGDAWSCGSLPLTRVKQQAGMSITLYPALTLQEQTLAVVEHQHPEQAEYFHRQGVGMLLVRSCASPLSQLKKELKAWNTAAMKLGKVVQAKPLWDDFSYAVVASLLTECELPRDEASFLALQAKIKAEINDRGRVLFALLDNIASLYTQVKKKLSGNMQLAWATVLTDINQQLDRLFTAGFLREIPYSHLQRYPVYLQGVLERLEKFQRDLNKQRLLSEQLVEFYQRYDGAVAKVLIGSPAQQYLQEYRWLLEEYRVSLFAQGLGTRVPVSEKRLNKFWREFCVND